MNSNITERFEALVADPVKRFQMFFDFYCDVKIREDFSIDQYVRSGKELLRMANIYLSEKNYFHSFVLYSRYSL
jgi:hypothetical protein